MAKHETPVMLMDGSFKPASVWTHDIVGCMDRGIGPDGSYESPRYIVTTYSGGNYYTDRPPTKSEFLAAHKQFSIYNAEQLGLQLCEEDPEHKR